MHTQKYFYEEQHTVQSWSDDDIPIPFAARQKSITEANLPHTPTLIQLASLFPMGCLGGDQIRINFGAKIKCSLDTLRQHLANILVTRLRGWSLISWDFAEVFLKGTWPIMNCQQLQIIQR